MILSENSVSGVRKVKILGSMERAYASRWTRAVLFAAAFAAAPAAAGAEPSYGHEIPAAVMSQLDRLLPQRPGVVDLYAVIVGADGEEDVFRKEVIAVRKVLDDGFDTRGRSITLINHRSSPQPEATLNSLAYVLKRVADKMDRDEDVLLLHLTTHGGSNHVLVFRHGQTELYGLNPPYLRKILADARIRYRVLVVSACYAGGFVAPLADARTLVITAASSSRQSYGCGNDSEITEFSRAYYLHALSRTRSLSEAARMAQQTITQEERESKRVHSHPQIQMGSDIEDQLKRLERRLSVR